MIAYVDGSPVLNKVAVVCEDIFETYEIVTPDVTNNMAEYLAVFYAMYFHRNITEVRSDSLLVVNQLNKKWKVKNPRLAQIHAKIRYLNYKHFSPQVKFTWIPRDDNPAGKHLEKMLKNYAQYAKDASTTWSGRDYYKS